MNERASDAVVIRATEELMAIVAECEGADDDALIAALAERCRVPDRTLRIMMAVPSEDSRVPTLGCFLIGFRLGQKAAVAPSP